MSIQQVREQAVTDEVIASFAGAPSERLREVMSSLVRHLHDFAREVRLTEAEWQRGIDFLTRVGHTTTDKRQEFILLSDVLGLSMLTVAVNAPATAGSTESTVFGPFFVEDAPEVPLGGDIARGAKGSPCYVVRDRPLRRWHAAAGSADRGLGSRRGRLLRRPVRRRSQRRPRLAARRSQRRIPLLVRATRALSDSLRRTGRRSAASRRPQPDAARAPALQGRRPGAPHPDHAHLRRGRQVPGVRRGIRRQEQPDRRRHRTSRGNRARRQSHRPSLPPDQLRHCACTKNTVLAPKDTVLAPQEDPS